MKKLISNIIQKLKIQHPNAICELDFASPFELLVAVILSAQCTDKRVNIITKELFKKYNTPKDFAQLSLEELTPLIYSCGFYRNKAKSIISASNSILENFNGNVPDNIEDLLKLRGVGNKTASVVYSVAFGGQAIAVDTHVFRVSRRIGLTEENTPDKVMYHLMSIIDKKSWSDFHHLLVHHGRYICKASNPNCKMCNIKTDCYYYRRQINE